MGRVLEVGLPVGADDLLGKSIGLGDWKVGGNYGFKIRSKSFTSM